MITAAFREYMIDGNDFSGAGVTDWWWQLGEETEVQVLSVRSGLCSDTSNILFSPQIFPMILHQSLVLRLKASNLLVREVHCCCHCDMIFKIHFLMSSAIWISSDVVERDLAAASTISLPRIWLCEGIQVRRICTPDCWRL